MKNRLAYAVAALVCGVTVNAGAQVYRCTTPNGGTEYSQVPCGKDAQLLQDRSQSIYTGPHVDPFDWIRREQEGKRAYEEAYQAEGRRFAAQQPVRSPACNAALTAAISALSSNPSSAAQLTAIAGAACNRPDIAAAALALANQPSTPPQRSSRPNVSAPPTATDTPASPFPDRRTLTNCDSNGCYDNKGARYNNMGQNFMGPTGMCRKTALGWSCP